MGSKEATDNRVGALLRVLGQDRERSVVLQRELGQHLAGWRIYVTNVQGKQMSLEQAIAYYRDEWLAERGFHRFKRGSNPALPLWVRLPERITGLMLQLMLALQALALLHGSETVYATEFCLPVPNY
jgi:transposase